MCHVLCREHVEHSAPSTMYMYHNVVQLQELCHVLCREHVEHSAPSTMYMYHNVVQLQELYFIFTCRNSCQSKYTFTLKNWTVTIALEQGYCCLFA